MRRYLLGIYFWFLVVVITFVNVSLAEITYWFLKGTGQSEKIPDKVHYIAGLWAKAFFSFIPGWYIIVEGRENLPEPGRAVIYVANHQSVTDIWGMYYLNTRFSWLAKAEVLKLPGIGRAFRHANYIPVLRGDKKSSIAAIQKGADQLRSRVSMFFFPEGTRSENLEIKAFRPGAFKLSIQENVPVVPIVLNGAGELIPKGSGMPSKATVQIRILPETSASSDEAVEDFSDRIRQDMIQHLAELKSKAPKHQ